MAELQSASSRRISGMDEELLEHLELLQLIAREAIGIKRGDPGSLANRGGCAHEAYTGMGDRAWQKKLQYNVLGQDAVHGSTPA